MPAGRRASPRRGNGPARTAGDGTAPRATTTRRPAVLRRGSSPPALDFSARGAADAAHLVQTLESEAGRVWRQEQPGPRGVLVSDPGAVHDLRVAARRLSAALRVWRPLIHGRSRRDVTRALRRIRRGFGALRELEVHVEALEGMRGLKPATAAAVVRLLRRWRARYARARGEALERMAPRRVRRLVRDLGRAFQPLRSGLAPGADAEAAVRARLARERERALAAVRAACAAPRTGDPGRFHRARIAIKRWRYVEERSSAAAGAEPALLGELKAMQEQLGDAHDRETLSADIARFARTSTARARALEPVLRRLESEMRASLEKFRALVLPLVVTSRRPAAPRAAALRRESSARR